MPPHPPAQASSASSKAVAPSLRVQVNTVNVRNAVEQQVSELDRKVMKLARHDAQVRRL
jgi:hypothetical protein